jgi:hypothetical protein
MKLQRFTFLVWFALASALHAWTVSPHALAAQSSQTRESQLQEFGEVFKPEFDTYLGLGWMYLPKPDQSRLFTPYGEHNGFAFRHRLSIFFQHPMDSSSLRLGWAWWVERQGWEAEDFLLVPSYSNLGVARSIHTTAVTLADSAHALGAALGVQWLNPESGNNQVQQPEEDSLWWFGHATWRQFATQAEFHGAELSMVRANANLGARALRGGDSVGLSTYLPDWEFLWLRGANDPIRLTWRQNIWHQQIYVHASAWPVQGQEGSGSLFFYTDASQLVGAELALRRTRDGKVLVGGGIEVPFLRVSCNLPREYDQFFASRGTQILVEFHMSIGAIKNRAIFRRNAPRSARMEVESVKKSGTSAADSSGTWGGK